MTSHCQRVRRRNRRSGFALVLALSLMAFVVLLLLSITTLVQVESRAAKMQLQVLKARESARLALMIGMGELQKHAGPDQRVTARAEILGEGNFAPSARLWTGVWDTTNPSAAPVWLVSSVSANPNLVGLDHTLMQAAYDAGKDGDFSKSNEFEATLVPLQHLEDANISLAWWVVDEGVKAPIMVEDELLSKLKDHDADTPYLDYSTATNRTLPILHDPVFDFPELFDILTANDEDLSRIERSILIGQMQHLTEGMPADQQESLRAAFNESATFKTAFVLSNVLEGGLKKDLSFLKTVDIATYSQAEMDSSYGDPDQLLNTDFVKAIQFRGNPAAFPDDEIIGLQLSEPTLAAIEAKTADFTLAPVITEFQLSCAVAADDAGLNTAADRSTASDSAVYLIYKLYLEVWNPYTIPMRVGDENLAANLGYSDLLVEIENLPSYNIQNVTSPGSPVTGELPKLSILWSDYAPHKLLKPGMVFERTLPSDSGGDGGDGVLRIDLGKTILGSYDDDFVGSFSFTSAPLKITIYGLQAGQNQKEILTAEISAYPDFMIDYDSSNARTRFKRDMSTSNAAIGGMTKASLEQSQSYAFAFRFRMLDEQEVPGPFQDISNWLSQTDFRHQKIVVDLDSWDINDAWSGSSVLPYDFFLNDETAAPDYYDPGQFNPTESFRSTDFFQYGSGTGRLDRIARFVDVPTSEITDIGSLRALHFSDFPVNGIGNRWGGLLNQLYDRYFFSTLPDPKHYELTNEDVLANSHLRAIAAMPTLVDPDAAEALYVENGFNLNSTSIEAWRRILSGKKFLPEDFMSRYEIGIYSNPSEWFMHTDSLAGAFFNNPHTAAYNLSEKQNNPCYALITRKSEVDHDSYLNRFSIDNVNWQSNRQFPTFLQPIRELRDEDINALASAIVDELIIYAQDKGHPSMSISEFLNAGILENAINRVSAINNRRDDIDSIPAYTPSSISQATIMNAIGSKSFVRSDTFKIRAYAETKSPIDDSLITSAMCEATVQRLPTLHDDLFMGRKFQLTDFRWIDPIH